MIVWLQFAVCALAITFAGAKLSKYGDIIGRLTGLGSTWVGLVLIASVTSLPELITGTASIVLYNVPELAVGDIMGSCMFNMAIIGLLDFLSRGKPVLSLGGDSNVLNGGFVILLLGVVNISFFLGDTVPAIGWIGAYTPVLITGYLLAAWVLFKFEHRPQPVSHAGVEEKLRGMTKTRAFAIYGVNAVIVIAASSWLPYLGKGIAAMTGLEQSFVGTLFIALSTSLPEFVVTFAALRGGLIKMALGNLFGSNLFNLLVLAIDDLVYTEGPLLTAVSQSHSLSASTAILMTATALIGLAYRGPSKRFGFGWSSVMLVLLFLIGALLSYVHGRG